MDLSNPFGTMLLHTFGDKQNRDYCFLFASVFEENKISAFHLELLISFGD